MNPKETPTHCAYPKCGKELVHVEGRKKKKYCDQKCNSAHWQAVHYVPSDKKPKFKKVPIEEWLKVFGGMEKVTSEHTFTKGKTKEVIKPIAATSTETVTVTIPSSDLHPDYQIKTDMDRIKVLESEIKNPPAKLVIPKAMYISVRQKELSELKLKHNQ